MGEGNGSFYHTLATAKDLSKSDAHNTGLSPPKRKSLCERWMEQYNESTKVVKIMSYKRHKNQHWDDTFRSMGWSKLMVESFWRIFCHINLSRTGEFTFDEFLAYFELENTRYTEKCFEYFDTTGGGDIDFLEFIISVWNVCPMAPETLPYFAFDIYDINADGELSAPEIELMIGELFGKDHTGGNSSTGAYDPDKYSVLAKACLDEFLHHSQERAGRLTVDAFSNIVQRHSMLLFPIFEIQNAIRRKVMGDHYWQSAYEKRLRRERRERKLSKKSKFHQKVIQPRQVQVVLRAYKAKSAAAFMTHTGDPNEGLRRWMERERQGLNDMMLPVADDESEIESSAQIKEKAFA